MNLGWRPGAFLAIAKLGLVVLLSLPGLWCAAQADQRATNYEIGVYYFPGWSDLQKGAPFEHPWEKLAPFPERRPLIGWYSDSSVDVLTKQIAEMHRSGITYVAFDWYWTDDGQVILDQALRAYLAAKNRKLVQFCLLWANHSRAPASQTDWKKMIGAWIANFFGSDSYYRIDGKPVVIVFSAAQLSRQAASLGVTAKQLIDMADRLARQGGYPGIYWIAGLSGSADDRHYTGSGYSAVSAYNYHQGPSDPHLSYSFRELDAGYQRQWDGLAQEAGLSVVVPVATGWDHRPWGATVDPLHDNSSPTLGEFRRHLAAAKRMMDRTRTNGVGRAVICCWNEFGEGSYLEPTVGRGTGFLDTLCRVFPSNCAPSPSDVARRRKGAPAPVSGR